MTISKDILKETLALPPLERAELVGQLLSSLDIPDEKIDKMWEKEVEERIEAYEAGKIKAVSFEDVLAKYK